MDAELEILECGHPASAHSEFTTGYGVNPTTGSRACCQCCAQEDTDFMRKYGEAVLYFDGAKITNWPGSLVFQPTSIRKSRHNFGGWRYDFWFWFENTLWHGYQIGDMNQIAHCKRTKTTR